MKSFKKLISEVAQPKPEEEKKFKAQHNVEVTPHPVASETQHKGVVKPKAKRKADQEGDANYDAAYGVNEEVEELDEISRGLARSYIRKAAAAGGRKKGIEMAGKKAYSIGGEPKVRATESFDLSDYTIEELEDFMMSEDFDQLDEISKKTLGSYIKKAKTDVAGKAYQLGARDPLKPKASWSKTMSREKNIDKAVDRLTKEEVEQLDELSPNTLHSYIKKAVDNKGMHDRTVGRSGYKDRDSIRKSDNRVRGITGAVKKLTKEEVEQLAELSPNTLHSYIKKAAGNMAGNAAVAAAQASSSMKKSSPDVKRKIKNRMQGITGASGRLADKANMAENWQEEIPMMMRQLEFIAYAAEEIMDYVDMAGDPEEWFQNKISGIHQSMLSMYAYAQGGRRAGYGFDESVEEELKGGQKKLDHNKNGKLDAHDFHLMRKKKMKEEAEQLDEIGDTPAGKKKLKNLIVNRTKKAVDAGASLERRPEKAAQYDKAQKRHMKTIGRAAERLAKEEVELDEAAPKMKPDFLKTQREKDRAHDAAMGRTPTGRKKPVRQMTSTQRSLASMRNEEVEELDEISSDLKSRYAKKAATSLKRATTYKAKAQDDAAKASKNIDRGYSGDRSVNVDKQYDRLDRADSKVAKHDKTISKRTTGLKRANEEVESLDEAFKQGIVKLKDGSSVGLKKEDADLLNQMFKDLSANNRKKMQEVAMKDKAGFEEILGFAREAL